MPQYKCANCGEIRYGWGSSRICPICGGVLEPANETAKIREINKEKK